VGERLAESGVSVDLDQQGGQMDLRQAGGDRLRECLGFGGNLFGGQINWCGCVSYVLPVVSEAPPSACRYVANDSSDESAR
jgi:hypothetical protein